MTKSIVVVGKIAGEPTFGATLMVELVPRDGNTGTVSFTAVGDQAAQRSQVPVHKGTLRVERTSGKPDVVRVTASQRVSVDITGYDGPWPEDGNFTPFDSDLSGSTQLNGAIIDNGTFIAAPVSFNGRLAAFPVVASNDAFGIWDIRLSTAQGESSWEGVTTSLSAGMITVGRRVCHSDSECDDGSACTLDRCRVGSCYNERLNSASCEQETKSRKRIRRGPASR